MNFWLWFKTDGDKVCTFAALFALALHGQAGVPAQVLQWATVIGLMATAAHQSFFPNTPK